MMSPMSSDNAHRTRWTVRQSSLVTAQIARITQSPVTRFSGFGLYTCHGIFKPRFHKNIVHDLPQRPGACLRHFRRHFHVKSADHQRLIKIGHILTFRPP